jgi:hypothetical protein
VEFKAQRADTAHAQNFQEVRLRDINPAGGAIAGVTALCTHELCLSQWGFFTSYPEMCIFLQTFPMYGLLCGADFGLCCGLSAKVGSNNQKEPDPRHRRSRCESNDHNSRIIEMLSAGPTMRRLPALVFRQVAPHSALRQGLGHN